MEMGEYSVGWVRLKDMAKSRRLAAGLVFSIFLAGAGMAMAQQEKVPSEQLIVRLLTLESERLPSDYRVAIVLPGEMRGRAGFVVEKAARVTFIGPIFEGGSKRRGVCGDFLLERRLRVVSLRD